MKKSPMLIAAMCLALASCARERESIRHYELRFSEGFAPVMQDGKWGFIDRSGRLVIAPQYDRVLPFAEGLAQVRMRGA